MPSIKYFSSRGGWPWAHDVSFPRKVTPGPPGRNFFVQCPGFIFLAARWSGSAASASVFSVCLDYILRVLSKSVGFVSLSGKASLVSISSSRPPRVSLAPKTLFPKTPFPFPFKRLPRRLTSCRKNRPTISFVFSVFSLSAVGIPFARH